MNMPRCAALLVRHANTRAKGVSDTSRPSGIPQEQRARVLTTEKKADEPKTRTKELRRMLGIVVGLLAGLAGLLMALLATVVMAILSPVLSFYQSIAGMAVIAKTARRSAITETRSDRDAKVKKLPAGRGNVEEPRLAA